VTRLHTFNYRNEPGERRGLVNRAVHVYDLPRPALRCRWFGHKPVIDGTGTVGQPGHLSRWVTCDRCGTRPEPQGRLDPVLWDIGEAYPKPGDVREASPGETNPGPWPDRLTWDGGFQLLIGSAHPGLGIQLKVGNAGSENTLDGHLHLGRAFGIYWHAGELGRGLQRRLNPIGYESKVLDLAAHDGRIRWNLGMPRDSYKNTWPRWRYGSVRYRPLDILLGERRYSHDKAGDPVDAQLFLEHGESYRLELQLERVTSSRKRGRTRFEHWSVDWDSTEAIPTRPHDRGGISGASVRIGADPDRDMWADTALDLVRAFITERREKYGYTAIKEGSDHAE
jgi:hypothetical protein